MSNLSIPQTAKAIAVFSHSRIVPIFFAVFAVILAAVSGFVLYLGTTLPQKTLNDSAAVTLRNGAKLGTHSNINIIYGAAAFLALLALLVLVMRAVMLKRQKSRFELHEDGVVHESAGTRSYAAFADIQDLYLFAAGKTAMAGMINNFAYRTGSDKPWILASGELKGFYDFMDEFRSRYVSHRMPVLKQKLADGKRVNFHYISSGEVYKKRFFGDFLNFKTQELALSAEGLHVDGVTWPRASLKCMNLNDWTEKVTIKDTAGGTVFSCIGTGILSFDLFTNMIDEEIIQTSYA
ncbi:hypothetical protein [Janthinobacterium fluminis]|uniref:Uncharacterized protein n=1 Tax=Janthinobacterium fluminis TaxID=2987524 RepID=A0ABT5K3F5_9BURK|nr:hypothetical protein [Janthinobacterium fluminis]MDC8759513.1 hypothetical protein [Janthinobacterium fluminis]